jgi:hypothetical protein
MRWFLSLVAALAFCPANLDGAEAAGNSGDLSPNVYEFDSSSITPTPEMWFYLQQQRRHDDPKMMVRRNAEQRAAQRRDRLAAMKWFGLSNQRPQANPTPLFGVYSPGWAAGLWQPYRWIGAGYSSVLLLTDGMWARPVAP